MLLTPAVLLVVALPLLFVGCTPFDAAEGAPTTNPPTPATQTTFRLEMEPNLQTDLASPLVTIEVTWFVESSTGTPAAITLPTGIVTSVTTGMHPRHEEPHIVA